MVFSSRIYKRMRYEDLTVFQKDLAKDNIRDCVDTNYGKRTSQDKCFTKDCYVVFFIAAEHFGFTCVKTIVFQIFFLRN